VTPVIESRSMLNISSDPITPQDTALESGRNSTLNAGLEMTPDSGPRMTTSLVDISGDDDIAVTQFGRLKVGFTPGMDGKSRRVCVTCCLHPLQCLTFLLSHLLKSKF